MIKQAVWVLLLANIVAIVGSQPRAQESNLTTRWAAEVTPNNALPDYPRPQMVREDWLNLNGLWQYALTEVGATAPVAYDGEILVPFPIGSLLSGVQQRVNDEALWYQRTFLIPEDWDAERVLLHLGAVDWEATVWINGVELGTHRGGYDTFSFDITDALTKTGGQEIILRVLDPTDAGTQPRGKQALHPEGVWYTPTTGIWQTVWLEPTSDADIHNVKFTPDVDRSIVEIGVETSGAVAGKAIRVTILDDGMLVAIKQSNEQIDGRFTFEMHIENPRLWSPNSPFLYDVQIEYFDANQTAVAAVSSYFGMRKISLGRDRNGDLRLFLNNEPLFQLGLLDQGFWPDGLYTAPTDEALRFDIEVAKQLGFNMIRKHVKVEPERWYYWADRLGILVWQDMPGGDAFALSDDREIIRSDASAAQFELELQRMVETHYNHPSVVMWVLFNEGWGQYDTARLTAWLKELDPTRLIDNASGWYDLGVGDVADIHLYPGPAAPVSDPTRAAVLGEFGGLGLPLSGHLWQQEANWGYRQLDDTNTLREAYSDLIFRLRELIEHQRLSAAVYTQMTDVETEVNGMMTYDRGVIKMGADVVREINRTVYDPLPQRHALVPTSELDGTIWQYTTDEPGDPWTAVGYDDSIWVEGPGGFGMGETSLDIVRTEWSEPQLWLRHRFRLETAEVHALHLRVHHIEDVEVYLNGRQIALLPLSTTDYVEVPLVDEVRELLRAGENVLAVHAFAPTFGFPPEGPLQQYIDVGLYDIETGS